MYMQIYVCKYMYVYIYIYTYMHILHICIYICIHYTETTQSEALILCPYSQTPIHTHTHTHTYIHVIMCACDTHLHKKKRHLAILEDRLVDGPRLLKRHEMVAIHIKPREEVVLWGRPPNHSGFDLQSANYLQGKGKKCEFSIQKLRVIFCPLA